MSVNTEQQPSFATVPEQEHVPHRRERGPNYDESYRTLAALALTMGRLEDRQTYLYWAEENMRPKQ